MLCIISIFVLLQNLEGTVLVVAIIHNYLNHILNRPVIPRPVY